MPLKAHATHLGLHSAEHLSSFAFAACMPVPLSTGIVFVWRLLRYRFNVQRSDAAVERKPFYDRHNAVLFLGTCTFGFQDVVTVITPCQIVISNRVKTDALLYVYSDNRININV